MHYCVSHRPILCRTGLSHGSITLPLSQNGHWQHAEHSVGGHFWKAATRGSRALHAPMDTASLSGASKAVAGSGWGGGDTGQGGTGVGRLQDRVDLAATVCAESLFFAASLPLSSWTCARYRVGKGTRSIVEKKAYGGLRINSPFWQSCTSKGCVCVDQVFRA